MPIATLSTPDAVSRHRRWTTYVPAALRRITTWRARSRLRLRGIRSNASGNGVKDDPVKAYTQRDARV
ncbi:uncharacterized protein ColSpa_06384 [Colletotrichum spaethianum]|uniref:Uncharacterized protein n=1 Tax=Colletotrichum spaethianum TaxID=700344 RepID=A0AA37LGR1_9PEZI|nr:uncharacterized protein ColSpa_06384 [Colletotrichum spaethianum]GKT46203.1 hypothetical protein ColSpa_06384 [Colletotrichum spaethianum]